MMKQIRKVLAELIKSHGHAILEFVEAVEAMRVIEKTKPRIDCAVIDLVTPGYGGNIGRFLRRYPQYSTIPPIYYSAVTKQ